MIDASKEAIAKRLAEIFKDSGDTLEAFAGVADKTRQAATGWLRTGRLSQKTMSDICDHYGYSLLWLMTGQGPKRPLSIQDAPVAGPGMPEGSRGRDLFQKPLFQRAQGLAQAIIDAAERGQMDDGAISALESELQRLITNVEAAREAGIRIAAEDALRELEQEQGTRVPDSDREGILRDLAGRIRAKYEDRKGNGGGSSEGISASRSEGQCS